MSFAFDDPPDSGVKVSARAGAAPIRDARTTAARAVKSRRLGMPVGKAAGSYIRLRDLLHFVPYGTQDPWKAGSRFSTKALTPSWKSFVRASACWSSDSRSSWPSRSG
jgi:hypothetical protein